MVSAGLAATALLASCAHVAPTAAPAARAVATQETTAARPVKVMIVSMFGPEAQPWIDRLGPWQTIPVAGLAPDYPAVRCNAGDVCIVTTGMGHANAAASITALALAPQFDLRKTYFLIAGIAGINPERGTLGSAAWATWLVDFGLQWEIDAREKPAHWPSGYLGINTKGPADKPPLDYRTEVFHVNPRLSAAAYALSRGVALADSAAAQATRAHYRDAPANRPPAVIQCDTLSSDTWWAGTALAKRADTWMRLLTDGQGRYCTTQQEDNATYEALTRAAAAHRVDLDRVAVLRTGSDFDRPYAHETSADALLDYAREGGFEPAIENLFRAGNPLVQDIATHWDAWQAGVPPR